MAGPTENALLQGSVSIFDNSANISIFTRLLNFLYSASGTAGGTVINSAVQIGTSSTTIPIPKSGAAFLYLCNQDSIAVITVTFTQNSITSTVILNPLSCLIIANIVSGNSVQITALAAISTVANSVIESVAVI